MGVIGRPSASSVSVPKFSIGTADRFAYMGQYVSKRHAKSSSYFGKQSPGPATYNTRGGTNQKGLVTVSDASGRTPPSYSFGGDVNRPSPFRVGGLCNPTPPRPRLLLAQFPVLSLQVPQRTHAFCAYALAVILVPRSNLLPADGLLELPREGHEPLLPSAGILLHGFGPYQR